MLSCHGWMSSLSLFLSSLAFVFATALSLASDVFASPFAAPLLVLPFAS